MTDQEKMNALYRYLESRFQGCKIRGGHDIQLDAQLLRITCGGSIYNTGISDELLTDEEYEASDILTLVEKYRLAEELQKVENTNTRIIITSKGLILKQEY